MLCIVLFLIIFGAHCFVSVNFPLKVLHVASGDLWAGAEVQLLTLVREQMAMPDVDVQVALMNDGEAATRMRALGVPLHIFDESILSTRALIRGLHDLLWYNRPHIIHTHRSKENVLTAIANLSAYRAPSVRTVHGAAEYEGGIRQYVIRFADWFTGAFLQQRLIAVSADLAGRLNAPFHTNKIRVIHNGVDAAALAPLRRQRKSAEKHIGIVGRLQTVKRVDLFIDMAARMLADEGEQKLHFDIYGDGPLRTQLQARVAGPALSARLTFHGHCDDIYPRIAALDCLVMCSDHEGLPMTLLESLALGVPVVAHAVGGMPELLREQTACRLVEQHTAQAYAAAVFDVLRQAPGDEISLPEEFSAAQNARLTVDLYRELLASA